MVCGVVIGETKYSPLGLKWTNKGNAYLGISEEFEQLTLLK